jgi:hypothetical protein
MALHLRPNLQVWLSSLTKNILYLTDFGPSTGYLPCDLIPEPTSKNISWVWRDPLMGNDPTLARCKMRQTRIRP